jgi:hypothetical protein
MDSRSKAEATDSKQGPEMSFTVTAMPQQNLKQMNMIGGSADGTSQNVKGSKLTLAFSKADNDNINNLSNNKYDKIHDKNEENHRLLTIGSVPQKKILIVPSLRQEAVVSTNGVRLKTTVPSTFSRDVVSVGSTPTSNGGLSDTEGSELQSKDATVNRELRSPNCMTGLELPRLEENIRAGHNLPITMSSLRSLKLQDAESPQPVITPPGPDWRSFCFSEVASQVSVRSLASVGMGSTDGRKVTIRRVPTSPTELFNIVHSPT